MRKVRRLLKENWIPIAVGILLTKWAVDYAYRVRGYDAIGSEWLAYRLGYLKGKSSRSEWEGRSAEIGRMIGKYKEWVYGDQKSSQQNKSAKSRYSR